MNLIVKGYRLNSKRDQAYVYKHCVNILAQTVLHIFLHL